jgi:hypothetical protein
VRDRDLVAVGRERPRHSQTDPAIATSYQHRSAHVSPR